MDLRKENSRKKGVTRKIRFVGENQDMRSICRTAERGGGGE